MTPGTWISTQLDHVCAPLSRMLPDRTSGRRLGLGVARSLYPGLVAEGHHVPLSVVVDLAYLYIAPEQEELRVGPRWRLGRDLGDRYCSVINRQASGGGLSRWIAAARQGRVGRAREEQQGAAQLHEILEQDARRLLDRVVDTGGVVTFLRLACSALESLVPSGPLSGAARRLILGSDRARGTAADGGEQDITRHLVSFYRQLVTASPAPVLEDPEAATQLSMAAGYQDLGAEGLDLPLLQALLDYQPLADEKKRDQARELKPHHDSSQTQPARSPQEGNRGVDRRGNPTSTLRSYMARDHFIDLVHLDKVLYYQRRAPRTEPYTMALCWVLDVGPDASTRDVTGRTCSSASRELAALLLEDAARLLCKVPALKTAFTLVLHNGQAGDALRLRWLEPSADDLTRVPVHQRRHRPDAPGAQPWLVRLNRFIPQLFMVDVAFPEPLRGTPSPRALQGPLAAIKDGRPYQRALASALGSRRSPGPSRASSGAEQKYDLLGVTVLGEDGSGPGVAPTGTARDREALAPLTWMTEINHITMTRFRGAWNAAWPQTSTEQSWSGSADAYVSVREAATAALADQLVLLARGGS